MNITKNRSGSTLIFFLVAVSALAVLAVGIQKISSISVINELMFNQGNKARNLAYSGLEYAKGLISYYQTQNKTIDDLVASLNSNSGTYDLGGDRGSFIITAIKLTGTTLSVGVVGQTPDGPNQAKFQIPTVSTLTYSISTIPDNPVVPNGNYGAKIIFAGSKYIGDYVFADATFSNGGVIIDGSLDYIGTGTSAKDGCIHLVGNTIGSTDGLSHICSNTCIVLGGGNTYYGTVIAQGDVTVENGTLWGDIYSGGNVTITYSGHVHGDIHVHKVYTTASASQVDGTIYNESPIPSKCSSYTLPKHEKYSSSDFIDLDYTKENNWSGEQTIYGVQNISDHSYEYSYIKTKGGTKLCLDLSTKDSYINLFSKGDVEINGNIYIKTIDGEDCFQSKNTFTKDNYSDFLYTTYASKVYIDVNGKTTINGGSNWFGTIYSYGDIIAGGGSVFIGALYTNGTLNASGGIVQYFVKSDYANKYWK